MLPGSHLVPINTNNPALARGALGNPAPGNSLADALHSPRLLADAFSDFISASSLLEASYRDLQQEVAHLGYELAERNTALTRSLAENDRMRAALQQMIDSMPCGVLVLDTSETIVMINPECRRLLELGGAPVKSLRDISNASQVNFDLLIVKPEAHLESELCISSSAGKRWLAIGNRELSCAPAKQAQRGERASLQTIWILRDITANKQAEQEREAARNATALAEISTMLAHEIRNPLASMELFAGLLVADRESSRDEASQWISHLRAGIRTLSGTVNNVLSINSGNNPHRAVLNLSSCVQAGVEFVQPIAEQAGVSLSFQGEENGLTIEGNEDGIRQIILNLVCNAIRHTPAGGKIEVWAGAVVHPGSTRARIDVTDTGCGIAAQAMEHLFNAGFSTNGDTPGLGLAVCKQLMHQHGGEIRAFSRIGSGSTFQLEFPTL